MAMSVCKMGNIGGGIMGIEMQCQGQSQKTDGNPNWLLLLLKTFVDPHQLLHKAQTPHWDSDLQPGFNLPFQICPFTSLSPCPWGLTKHKPYALATHDCSCFPPTSFTEVHAYFFQNTYLFCCKYWLTCLPPTSTELFEGLAYYLDYSTSKEISNPILV